MTGEISTLGWILLIGLVIFIVSINVALFTSARKKPNKNNWVEQMRKANLALKDPWKKEDQSLNELSQLAGQLKEQTKKESQE